MSDLLSREKLLKEVLAPFAQAPGQILDLFKCQRRRPSAAVLPSVDGWVGHAEPGREFFLGEPGSLTKLTD